MALRSISISGNRTKKPKHCQSEHMLPYGQESRIAQALDSHGVSYLILYRSILSYLSSISKFVSV